MSTMSADLLRFDYINTLPHPLFAWHLCRWWPVHDIEVQTGLLRIEVGEMLDVLHISGVPSFKDADGNEHDSETFYS